MYGIRGTANNWFKSYLTNRSQYVSYSGKKSLLREVLCGVPQGSVLGPLLFILYINDLPNAILFSETTLFADDTGLLYSNSSLKNIEKCVNIDLKRLFKWLCANKISLNISKTEVLLFRNVHKRIDHNVRLKLNGKLLNFSNHVKYLGIYIDCLLSWNKHHEYVSSKLRNSNGIISKLRYLVPKSTLMCLYNSLFDAHLRYACQVWAQNINPNSNRIFIIQKQCVRLLTFSDFNSHSSPLFFQLKILKLADLVKLLNILLIYKTLLGLSPSKITNLFNLKYYPETHITRRKTKGLLAKT
jgi:hypothetical protein